MTQAAAYALAFGCTTAGFVLVARYARARNGRAPPFVGGLPALSFLVWGVGLAALASFAFATKSSNPDQPGWLVPRALIGAVVMFLVGLGIRALATRRR